MTGKADTVANTVWGTHPTKRQSPRANSPTGLDKRPALAPLTLIPDVHTIVCASGSDTSRRRLRACVHRSQPCVLLLVAIPATSSYLRFLYRCQRRESLSRDITRCAAR